MPASPAFRDNQYTQAAKAVENIEAMLALQFPIQLVLNALRQIHGKLFQLDNKTCTGTVHWRDGNKMMIIHRTEHSCPLHGEPPTGGRIRTYIGTDSTRQAAAQAAIDALPEQARFEQHAAHCLRQIHRTRNALAQVHDQLELLQENVTRKDPL